VILSKLAESILDEFYLFSLKSLDIKLVIPCNISIGEKMEVTGKEIISK
jgi:hypothetical protein